MGKSQGLLPRRIKFSTDIFGKGLNYRRETLYTWIGIWITLVATVFLWWELLAAFALSIDARNLVSGIEQMTFFVVVTFLIYGNLLYQFTRVGYMKRLRTHRPALHEELETIYDQESAPSLVTLIPSYKEETRIVRQAILSAALQQYPNGRVVLLIDNPPNPEEPEERMALIEARSLSQEIGTLLEEPAARFGRELKGFEERGKSQKIIPLEEMLRLAGLNLEAAKWFEKQAVRYPVTDHVDELFVQVTFLDAAESHRRRADEFEQRVLNGGAIPEQRLLREYKRLAGVFNIEIANFERKRYENLSHASNKAMNLNSYIGLLGKGFKEVRRDGHLHLVPGGSGQGTISIPDADYIITLDADSMLSNEYALRLVHLMEQPGNERLGVVQTPYTAPPNAPGVLERVAGATTDMQYIVHQGFTRHGGTFWVGANALLRKSALEEICVIQEERGFQINLFIQDRTVIEDTESSVDLICNDWKLFNYPERLSYSATPPDFGSLLIQRRRWANGGLIILPKLIRYLFAKPSRFLKSLEGFMRIHYLTSIAGVNISLLLILAYPFEDSMRSLWLPITAIPYFFFYGRDLVQAGYKGVDLLRIYALNLMLLPINLGGVFKSLHQAFTGIQIPFARTPKIEGFTTAPSLYILAEYFILFYCITGSIVDIYFGRWSHAAFGLFNAMFFAYAIHSFIGLKTSKENLLVNWKRSRWYVPVSPRRRAQYEKSG